MRNMSGASNLTLIDGGLGCGGSSRRARIERAAALYVPAFVTEMLQLCCTVVLVLLALRLMEPVWLAVLVGVAWGLALAAAIDAAVTEPVARAAAAMGNAAAMLAARFDAMGSHGRGHHGD